MFTSRPPVHPHVDCNKCEYVGGFNATDRLYDIWVHQDAEDWCTAIIRYGPDDQYYSHSYNPADMKKGCKHLTIVQALSNFAVALRSAGAPLRDVDRSQ